MRTVLAGPRLRQLLERAELSQADAARLLNVDSGQVSRWVNGRAAPRREHAQRLVALLADRGVDVDGAAVAKVFFSTPMAALDEATYGADRLAGQAVYEQLRALCEPVYWAAADIESAAGFQAPDLATEQNLVALADAEAVVYLQLHELRRPTSCHVELGMALALRKSVTVFAASETMLPYTMQQLSSISARSDLVGRYRFYPVQGAEDAVRLLTVNGPELLGLSQPHRLLETA